MKASKYFFLLFSSFTILLTLSVPARAPAEDQWFCKEGASRLLGEVLESCGIGKSKDEAEARKKALDGAFDEFDHICRESVNCRDYEKTVEPMRTECILGKDEVYTCYRALDFTVTHQKKEKPFADQDKKEAVVSAIASHHDDATADPNPELANTASPSPSPSHGSAYANVRMYTVYNPYVYVIGSQPQVVYVRSSLPPQYAPVVINHSPTITHALPAVHRSISRPRREHRSRAQRRGRPRHHP